MNLTRTAIYRPVTTLMCSLALVILGVISWGELSVQYFPDFTFPAMSYYVWIEDSDLLPEETNDLLTRPFEKMVASLPGLKETLSSTQSGSFWGRAQFDQGGDMRFRVIELQDKINKWRAQLDEEIQYEITPFSTDEFSGNLMELILSIPIGQEFRSGKYADLVRRKIRAINGIAKVDVSGEMEPNITLETERDQLLSHGLDVRTLVSTINSSSREKTWMGPLEAPRPEEDDGSPLALGGDSTEIYLEAEIKSVDELLQTPVALPASPGQGANASATESPLTIGDLARRKESEIEQKSIFRFNGKKSIRIGVSREKDKNTIRMAKKVRERVEELRKELPAGFTLTIQEDEAKDLEKMIKIVVKLAALGATLAMVVLLVFLRRWRVAMVVGVAIPVSVIVTFNAFYAAGVSINFISLLGLIIVVGMLVDNAIVVVENVYRHAQRHTDPREAAWEGSREVVRAILISTSTTLVVFVPIFYAIDEEFIMLMKEMALSIIFPMVVSLLVAITLIPMLTAQVCSLGKEEKKPRSKAGRFALRLFEKNPFHKPGRKARNLLKEFVFFCAKAFLRHPARLFFAMLTLLLLTIFVSCIKLAVEGGPENQKTRTVTLYGKPPLGSTIEETDAFFLKKENEIDKFIQDTPAFETFSSRFDEKTGRIELRVADDFQKINEHRFRYEYGDTLSSGDDYKGFRMHPFAGAASGSQGNNWDFRRRFGESITVTGENMEAMLRACDTIEEFLKEDPNVKDADRDTPEGTPETQFIPDEELFRVMGADSSSIESFFRSRGNRGVPTNLKIIEKDIERKVLLQTILPRREQEEEEEGHRQTLGELKRSDVALRDGGSLPLERLGTFKIAQGVRDIRKKDRQRTVNVGFSLLEKIGRNPKEHQRFLKELQTKLNNLRLPSGVSASMSGTLEEARKRSEVWKTLGKLGILALFVTMAFFFDSLFLPVVILVTLPLASIGGFWGMIFLNTAFDTAGVVGALVLGGLAVNNGIILIEFARQMELRRGFSRQRALMTAVSHRMRPIIMTSMTTVLGLLPVLLSDEAEEMHALVAVAIGGITSSGLLSVIVVPTLYNVLSGWQDRMAAWRDWRVWQFLPRFTKKARSKPRLRSIDAVPTRAELEIPPESLRISIDNISKFYPAFKMRKLLHCIPSRDYPYGHRPPGGEAALRQVSLDIGPGMFGLLGPNGAGKTTLMKILTGLVTPTYGVARVAGFDMRSEASRARHLIGYLPQNFGVYGSQNLEQYLNFFAGLAGPLGAGLDDPVERRRRIDEAIEWVGLGDARDKPMKRYSGGMRQRAGIAQVLLTPRPILIVDEPTGGLDPVERVRFRLLLSKLARTRVVILSTHIVDDITSSCKRVAILNHGRMLYQGDIEGIQREARDLIWDVTLPGNTPAPMARKQILYRKYVGDDVLYHYVSDKPFPGSKSVAPSFEDAYVAHLLKHDGESGNGSAAIV